MRPAAGAGQPRRRFGRGQVLTAAAALMLVAIAITLILALNNNQAPEATADPTTANSAPASPTEELPAGGILDGAGSSGSQAEAEAAAPADESALRALIPLDFSADACTPTGRPAGDGSLAALSCGASISPGANASDFFLDDDESNLEAAFQAYVEERSLTELPSSSSAGCGQDQGFAPYSQGGPVLGQLACYIDSENTAYVVWTNTDLKVFAITSAASGDAQGLQTLYEWWVARGQIVRR